MADQSGRFRIVFNGEIYNHREIRAGLAVQQWQGESDTETIIEAWAQYGEDCLPRLRGMFAFAIWDTLDRRLTLVRDRYGIKPCYFRHRNDTTEFASEIRILCEGKRPQLTSTSLATFLSFGHLPGQGQLGDGVCSLPAGCLFSINANAQPKLTRWWSPEAAKTDVAPPQGRAPAETIRALIEESVGEHLLSDVPVGCFLSGGIDSSILAVTAGRLSNTRLQTFTVGFPGNKLDEREFARQVACKARTEHSEIDISALDCQQWIVEGVQAMDCPSVDAINTYIVSRSVAQSGLKVALSGLGADEILGGYPSFRSVSHLRWLKSIPKFALERIIPWMPYRISNKFSNLPAYDAFHLAVGCRRWHTLQGLRRYHVTAPAAWPLPAAEKGDYFADISDAEMQGYMEPMLLRDSDQMSMAVSLEIRVPFLDHRLVNFCINLPPRLKTGGVPKQLLIDAFPDVLPAAAAKRPKMGFTLPMEDWMRGNLKDFVEVGLKYAADVVEGSEIQRNYQRFLSQRLHWTRIWLLVVLGHYTGGRA